jgi:hypothetical protein
MEISMVYIDEIKSPFLRRVVEQRGIKDDQVTSLLIVERYVRQPEPTNSIVTLMLKAIDREHPLEAAVVRREFELGRSLTEMEMKKLQARVTLPTGALQVATVASPNSSGTAPAERLMAVPS